MHKWLAAIEIDGSIPSYGAIECRQFTKETRPLVDGVNKLLKRNVRSRFGKVIVILRSQSEVDELSMPHYVYDTMGGICMINFAYDLSNYLKQTDLKIKQELVFNIFKEEFGSLPEEIGLNGDEIMSIVERVHSEISK